MNVSMNIGGREVVQVVKGIGCIRIPTAVPTLGNTEDVRGERALPPEILRRVRRRVEIRLPVPVRNVINIKPSVVRITFPRIARPDSQAVAREENGFTESGGVMGRVRAIDQPVEAQAPVGCKIPDPDLSVAGLVVCCQQTPIQGKVGGKGRMSAQFTTSVAAEHNRRVCLGRPKRQEQKRENERYQAIRASKVETVGSS